MVNAGRGIANDEDGITFVHRNAQHLGDVEVTGKVTALSYAGTTASRIGLMLRGSMGADARMMSFVLELGPNGQRYRFQRRAQDGGNISNSEDMTVVPPDAGAPADMAEGDAADAAAPPAATLSPIWLKLVRVGQRFVGFVSDERHHLAGGHRPAQLRHRLERLRGRGADLGARGRFRHRPHRERDHRCADDHVAGAAGRRAATTRRTTRYDSGP